MPISPLTYKGLQLQLHLGAPPRSFVQRKQKSKRLFRAWIGPVLAENFGQRAGQPRAGEMVFLECQMRERDALTPLVECEEPARAQCFAKVGGDAGSVHIRLPSFKSRKPHRRGERSQRHVALGCLYAEGGAVGQFSLPHFPRRIRVERGAVCGQRHRLAHLGGKSEQQRARCQWAKGKVGVEGLRQFLCPLRVAPFALEREAELGHLLLARLQAEDAPRRRVPADEVTLQLLEYRSSATDDRHTRERGEAVPKARVAGMAFDLVEPIE